MSFYVGCLQHINHRNVPPIWIMQDMKEFSSSYLLSFFFGGGGEEQVHELTFDVVCLMYFDVDCVCFLMSYFCDPRYTQVMATQVKVVRFFSVIMFLRKL